MQNPDVGKWITAVHTLGKHLHGVKPADGWAGFGEGGLLHPALFEAAWARTASEATLGLLRGTKYLPQIYVERAGLESALRNWMDTSPRAALLLVAPMGAGKTSLFCRFAEELAQQREGDAVLLLLAGDVQATGEGRLFFNTPNRRPRNLR